MQSIFFIKASQGRAQFSSAKLGHGSLYTRSPKQVSALSGIAIEQVSCGDDFTLCLSSNGEVYTFGTNYTGCLGLGDNVEESDQSVYVPVKIPFFEMNSLKVVKISCGESHSIALTESNQVFTWGNGECGRLGHDDENERCEPTEIQFKIKYVFKAVFAGSDCSFLLTKDGKVLAFGNNEYNKLCLNEHAFRFKNEAKNIQV
jgi:alpha-tubulin suppressor-like RCC1 family protein